MKQNLTFLFLILLIIHICSCQIHRAVNTNDFKSDSLIILNSNKTLPRLADKNSKTTVCLFSIIGSFLVGLTGILPVFILPQLVNDHEKLTKSIRFKCLVSFAAGTLIGDVFIHLLPETYALLNHDDKKQYIFSGLWIIIGLLAFFLMEKLFPDNNTSANIKVYI